MDVQAPEVGAVDCPSYFILARSCASCLALRGNDGRDIGSCISAGVCT
jgi:hypothetical protein